MEPTELDELDNYAEYVNNNRYLEEEEIKPEPKNLRESLNIKHKQPKWLKERR